ncbi:MAG: 50S ribosomal protein L24 [Candidatus Micrarchaeota archaeon]
MKYEKTITMQPRKKRLANYHSEIHQMKRLLKIHLGKDLRQKYKKTALLAKKGDKVKVLTGEFRKREGKINEVDTKEAKIYVEGLIRKKQGGKEVFAALEPSNCILVEWNEPKRKEMKARKKPAAATTAQKPISQQPRPVTPQAKQVAPEALQKK